LMSCRTFTDKASTESRRGIENKKAAARYNATLQSSAFSAYGLKQTDKKRAG